MSLEKEEEERKDERESEQDDELSSCWLKVTTILEQQSINESATTILPDNLICSFPLTAIVTDKQQQQPKSLSTATNSSVLLQSSQASLSAVGNAFGMNQPGEMIGKEKSEDHYSCHQKDSLTEKDNQDSLLEKDDLTEEGKIDTKEIKDKKALEKEQVMIGNNNESSLIKRVDCSTDSMSSSCSVVVNGSDISIDNNNDDINPTTNTSAVSSGIGKITSAICSTNDLLSINDFTSQQFCSLPPSAVSSKQQLINSNHHHNPTLPLLPSHSIDRTTNSPATHQSSI